MNLRGALLAAAVLAALPAAAHAAPGTAEVDVEGGTATFEYDGDGVEVRSAEADLDFVSLVIGVDVPGADGVLEVTLERSFLDASFEGTDEEFIVIADGDEAGFEEEATAGSRTLRIEVPGGTDEVEIIGTAFGAAPEGGAAGPEAMEDTEGMAEPEAMEDTEGMAEPEAMEDTEGMAGPEGAAERDGGPAGDACGPGTVLMDGVCVLDQSCGPGTVLVDGVCVLDQGARPAGGFRDLAAGAGAGFFIAFIVMIVLWLMGRAGRDRSAPGR